MKKLLALIERNLSGKLCYTDFLSIIKIKLSERDGRKDIKKAFKDLDRDHTGKISCENLQEVAQIIGEDINNEEALVSLAGKFTLFKFFTFYASF
jgi:Ca2+-binding EF-hand superfamily protein